MRKFRAYLFSIKIVMIAIFLTNTIISCKQKDEIADDPAPPLSTSSCEELILYSGGIAFGDPGSYNDNFLLPVDPPDYRGGTWPAPPSPPNPPQVYLRQYDEPGTDRSLVQNFDWRTENFGPITGAILEFKAKPEGAQDFNDNIMIYRWHFAQNTIGSHAIAGAWLGSDGGNIKGLLGNAWNQTNYPTGHTFTIDLTNFPSDKFDRVHGGQRAPAYSKLSGVCYFVPAQAGDYQIEGGYDLTRMMNELKQMDFVIGDDSNTDYAKLTLTSCKCD